MCLWWSGSMFCLLDRERTGQKTGPRFLLLGAGPSIPKEMLLVLITPSLVGTPSPQRLPVAGHCVLQCRVDPQQTPDDSL